MQWSSLNTFICNTFFSRSVWCLRMPLIYNFHVWCLSNIHPSEHAASKQFLYVCHWIYISVNTFTTHKKTEVVLMQKMMTKSSNFWAAHTLTSTIQMADGRPRVAVPFPGAFYLARHRNVSIHKKESAPNRRGVIFGAALKTWFESYSIHRYWKHRLSRIEKSSFLQNVDHASLKLF